MMHREEDPDDLMSSQEWNGAVGLKEHRELPVTPRSQRERTQFS